MEGNSSSPADRKAMAELIRRCMPGVAALMAEKRRTLGDAYVVQCQQRGMAGEPGWFFAREGCLAVGTPWPADPSITAWCAGALPPGAALVVLRDKAADDGAH